MLDRTINKAVLTHDLYEKADAFFCILVPYTCSLLYPDLLANNTLNTTPQRGLCNKMYTTFCY